MKSVAVIGGGLAGCEAAFQLARLGIKTNIYEMRPDSTTPAHTGGDLAQIVCSNSLKSTALTTASGVLKQELEKCGNELLSIAKTCSVPAGSALAVDRKKFSELVQVKLKENRLINVCRSEVSTISNINEDYSIIATGPLTSDSLIPEISTLTGSDSLYFFDAIAPSVTYDSLDLNILYRASRYNKGDDDYLNAAMDKQTYYHFIDELNNAQRTEVKEFDKSDLFEGCKPVEEIAASGPETLAFGPMKPVGLQNSEQEKPYAVVQLRQENSDGTLWGLVGFQTRLKYGEQRRVFRLIPGLQNAEFVRLGQMHRNLYINTPTVLNRDFSAINNSAVFFAGQITGVEGYVESIASGMVTAWNVASKIYNLPTITWPQSTITGSLFSKYLFDATSSKFSPMNANFGILPNIPELPQGRKHRKLRKEAIAKHSEMSINSFVSSLEVRTLLDKAKGCID